MKKILVLIGVLFLPLSVNAMAISETFDVGDEIIVALKANEDGKAFHVLKTSAAGEETVVALYDGVVEGSPTIYDEPIPGTHEATSDITLTGENIYGKLTKGTEGWRTVTTRLLMINDLTGLGISAGTDNSYNVYKNFLWLAPFKLDGATDPSWYNYWTQSAATGLTEADAVGVYCMTYNESRTDDNGVYSSLVAKNINVISNGPKCAIRPVIIVKKEYILCNNSKPSTPVPTGVEDYYLSLGGILLITAAGVIVLRRKNLFAKI